MSSPDSSVVRKAAGSLDSPRSSGSSSEEGGTPPLRIPVVPEGRIARDEVELASSRCAWCRIKALTLRESDIAQVRDKSGMNSGYEVIIPDVDDRAHRPPTGFHTFYLNQVDMVFSFPILRFIAELCSHLGVSPSQLAPNSYSYILSLGILLSYFDVPLSNYTLMQLILVKRLGPGKFYVAP
ncbi:hypothetical protein F511_37698 [Dorcoceras hygrometricum]|uniref:Uncharacterized protein n=1 Tax=Dorcoceras hygrometricum TaxID=472368 RepID=A0A2Z7D4W3_9LAMI|nr:hypothetical protein F511_37698 [Dorcoceras hygrometricum]